MFKYGPWFLGIDWGHVPLWQTVYEADKQTAASSGHLIEANTGIACVIPAWRLFDILKSEEFVKSRKLDDDEHEKQQPLLSRNRCSCVPVRLRPLGHQAWNGTGLNCIAQRATARHGLTGSPRATSILLAGRCARRSGAEAPEAAA
jgi:hypothetical protein